MNVSAYYPSPLGIIEMVSYDGRTLGSLRFVDCDRHDIPIVRSPEIFRITAEWLDNYFNGKDPSPTPPLALQGSDFQNRVWQALLQITRGTTVTYGELAQRLHIKSARAIGQAVKRNPIAIIIPCHRVLASTGLGGYAYGMHRKAFLINRERTEVEYQL